VFLSLPLPPSCHYYDPLCVLFLQLVSCAPAPKNPNGHPNHPFSLFPQPTGSSYHPFSVTSSTPCWRPSPYVDILIDLPSHHQTILDQMHPTFLLSFLFLLLAFVTFLCPSASVCFSSVLVINPVRERVRKMRRDREHSPPDRASTPWL